MIRKVYFKTKKIINKTKYIIKEKIPTIIKMYLLTPSIISHLKSKNIKNIKKFNTNAWHLNYMYFTGELDNKKVFIKYNNNSNWIEHEISIIKYINENSKLLSRKIPKLYFYEVSSKHNYLVEEYFTYESLNNILLKEKKINKTKIYQEFIIIIQEMQKINLLHLDINSKNIYISENNDVYIIDFGFSIIKNYKDLSFIKNTKLRKLIIYNLNTQNRLAPGYIDDAISFLQVAKEIDFELISNNYDYWTDFNKLSNQLYFKCEEENNEIK